MQYPGMLQSLCRPLVGQRCPAGFIQERSQGQWVGFSESCRKGSFRRPRVGLLWDASASGTGHIPAVPSHHSGLRSDINLWIHFPHGSFELGLGHVEIAQRAIVIDSCLGEQRNRIQDVRLCCHLIPISLFIHP